MRIQRVKLTLIVLLKAHQTQKNSRTGGLFSSEPMIKDSETSLIVVTQQYGDEETHGKKQYSVYYFGV